MSVQLQLETTNVCNADCVFCPYGKQTRAKGTMDLALSQRIMKEASTIPAISALTFTGLGEPLLDRFLVDRIRYARTRWHPDFPISVFTNGSYLRPRLADALIEAGLTTLYVSLNAVTRQQRFDVMRVDDYDHVIAYIDYATKAGLGKMYVIPKGIISKDLMEVGDSDQFMQQFDGRAFLHLEGSWAGTSAMSLMRTTPKKACGRALGQVMVLWDGRVSACCFDGNGDVILGDLRTQTLRQLYGSDPALAFRTAHAEGRRSSIPICAACSSI